MLNRSIVTVLRWTLVPALVVASAVAFGQAVPYKYTVELISPSGTSTFEARRFEFGVEADSSWTKGGGASVGKPNPGKMRIVKGWDDSSFTLLQYVTTGRAFNKVIVRFSSLDNKGNYVPSLEITLESAFVTSYQQVGADHNVATLDNKANQGTMFETNELAEVQFVYKTIEMKNLINGKTFKWDVAASTAD